MTSTRQSTRQRRRLMVRLAYTTSFTGDVSPGGFSVRVMKVLPPETRLAGSIQMDAVELPFAGRVVWARPGDHRLGLTGWMGITFTRISDRFPRLIGTAPPREPGAGFASLGK